MMSASSPLRTASNSTLFYYFNNSHDIITKHIQSINSTVVNSLQDKVASVVAVLLTYNVRIGELLRLTTDDMIGCDRVIMVGEKGSNASVLWLPDIDNQLIGKYPLGETYKIFPIAYKRIYDAMRVRNIVLNKGTKHNQAVTHISRYLTAYNVAAKKNSTVAGECLRHKTDSSIAYYLKKRGL